MHKNLKYLLGIVALALVVLLIMIFGKSKKVEIAHRDWNKIKESGRLNVVVEKSTLGFQLVDGRANGFNYELVKAFSDTHGLELEVSVMNDLDSAITGLWKHEHDLLAMNIPNTTEMNNRLSLTVSILNSRLMLVQSLTEMDSLRSELITNHLQLKDVEITIPTNSPYSLRLENLSEEIAEPLKIRELNGVNLQDLVIAASNGKVKFTICDELQARKLSKSYPNFDFSFPLGFNQQYAWAVSKKSMGLLDELNKFLIDFLSTNDYWEIYRKYY